MHVHFHQERHRERERDLNRRLELNRLRADGKVVAARGRRTSGCSPIRFGEPATQPACSPCARSASLSAARTI